jgi:hypothetical protein
MSARTTLDFGLGVLHLDVLRARLRRQRRWMHALLLVAALVIVTALARPALTTQLLGQGTLALVGVPADATLALDGQQVSGPQVVALSGAHTLSYQRPGFYDTTLPLQITRDQTTTLTLPALRPRPTIQPVPLPGVGTRWQAAAPNGASGWRLVATTADQRPTPAPYSVSAPERAPTRTLLRLDALGLTRLAALEAYVAADERTTATGTNWAAYETGAPTRGGWLASAGRLTIRWPGGSTVLTPTAPISGLWWAPSGQQLLVALQQGAGQDLVLWSPGVTTLDAPIVTVPGQIATVQWQPQGRAAVVLSTNQPPRTAVSGTETPPAWDATLLLAPTHATESARALRLATPPPASLGLVPLAWHDDALLWVTVRGADWELQRVPFGAALPTRLGLVPPGTLALRVHDDQTLRLLVLADGVLTLRDGVSGATVLTLDDGPTMPGMSGAWQGDTLLLAREDALWYLTFLPTTLD